VASRVLKPEGEPKLVTSNNMKNDSHSLLEDGYVLLGRAKFRDPKLDESQAIEQGKSVGAWVILVSHQYVNTVTESVPFNQWTPDQTTVTEENAQIQHDPNKPPVTVQKQTVQTVQGQFQTTYVPVNMDYYEYSATFWAKAKPSPIGVLVEPLSDDQKKQLQTNKGVVVEVVIRGTPAYEADVLKGDILTSLADEQIQTPDQFFDIVARHRGETVNLILSRDGQAKTLSLTLSR
jgi:C-terminal processing protease CtpA/Prc